MTNAISGCKSCGSSKLAELTAEVCIHLPGLRGLDVDPIYAFPKLRICLECGLVQANLTEEELKQVREGEKKARGTSA